MREQLAKGVWALRVWPDGQASQTAHHRKTVNGQANPPLSGGVAKNDSSQPAA
jgi:hypothetical protein